MVEVVAALIWQGEKFMICQRPAHKARGLLWEFVGGKVEPGETKEQALARECREELAVELSVGEMFMEVTHEYLDITVHLTLFHATIAQGEPQKLEHNDIQWITPAEIPNYDFCPADQVILEKIVAIYGKKTSFEKIYQVVCRIPEGKVATYGQIARLAGNPRWARVVGYALHVNPAFGRIPCHRVVNRQGRTAPDFAFGGSDVQRAMLEAEGVTFRPDGTVDLDNHLWNGE